MMTDATFLRGENRPIRRLLRLPPVVVERWQDGTAG